VRGSVVMFADQDQVPPVGPSAVAPVDEMVHLGLPLFSRTPSQWIGLVHGRGVCMGTKFSQEFKDQIVELHRRGGRSCADIAKEFDLSPTSVANWVRATEQREAAQVRRGHDRVAGEKADQATIRRLEKELARKEEELQILGKALAFFARRMDQ
jgi:transposase